MSIYHSLQLTTCFSNKEHQFQHGIVIITCGSCPVAGHEQVKEFGVTTKLAAHWEHHDIVHVSDLHKFMNAQLSCNLPSVQVPKSNLLQIFSFFTVFLFQRTRRKFICPGFVLQGKRISYKRKKKNHGKTIEYPNKLNEGSPIPPPLLLLG